MIFDDDPEKRDAVVTGRTLKAAKEVLSAVEEVRKDMGSAVALVDACDIIAYLFYELSVAELAAKLRGLADTFPVCECGKYIPNSKGGRNVRAKDWAGLVEFFHLLKGEPLRETIHGDKMLRLDRLINELQLVEP